MNALYHLQVEEDPEKKKLKFKEFVKDPFGREAEKREEERRALARQD